MQKEKVIGFKVPAESDIQDRLKTIVQKTRLKYGELLKKWIVNEEREIAELEAKQIPLFGGEKSPGMQELTEECNRLTELENRLLEKLSAKIAEQDKRITELIAARDAKHSRQSIPELKSGAHDFSERILELSAQGLSARQIARQLEAEGIKTQKGLTHWHHATITNIINKLTKK